MQVGYTLCSRMRIESYNLQLLRFTLAAAFLQEEADIEHGPFLVHSAEANLEQTNASAAGVTRKQDRKVWEWEREKAKNSKHGLIQDFFC